ncbi:2-dehydro-3-deoxyglucarate aldolase [Acidobacteria bacterium AB60]|nr:2-dehydro-3-deoxyglucarate aldolase [Acidobacteria bacterium AB60]
MDMATWASGPVKIGTLLSIDHPAVVEIARLAGFDWLWIDGEHGSFNEVSAATACAINAGGPPAFVRLPDRSPTSIKRFLDIGCDGIILPQVSSPEELDVVERAALYPPRGERSIGLTRAHGYGLRFAEYLSRKSYAIIIQIESVAGVENAAALIAHPVVDAVIIGPYDLSSSFGIPGQVDSPQVASSIASVLGLCKQAGKRCGIFAAAAEKARAYAQMNFDLIAVGLDATTLLAGFTALRNCLS